MEGIGSYLYFHDISYLMMIHPLPFVKVFVHLEFSMFDSCILNCGVLGFFFLFFLFLILLHYGVLVSFVIFLSICRFLLCNSLPSLTHLSLIFRFFLVAISASWVKNY